MELQSQAGRRGLALNKHSFASRLSSKDNSVLEAGRLCNSVISCNLPLLRRYLRAHANVNAFDYDKRTALHISAAEGNAPVVSATASTT